MGGVFAIFPFECLWILELLFVATVVVVVVASIVVVVVIVVAAHFGLTFKV